MAPDLIAGFIPSPDQGVWHLGPFPLRAYALVTVPYVLAIQVIRLISPSSPSSMICLIFR